MSVWIFHILMIEKYLSHLLRVALKLSQFIMRPDSYAVLGKAIWFKCTLFHFGIIAFQSGWQYFCNEMLEIYDVRWIDWAIFDKSFGHTQQTAVVYPAYAHLTNKKQDFVRTRKNHGPWLGQKLTRLLLRWCFWLAFYSFHFNMHFICWKCLIDFMQIISISSGPAL